MALPPGLWPVESNPIMGWSWPMCRTMSISELAGLEFWTLNVLIVFLLIFSFSHFYILNDSFYDSFYIRKIAYTHKN